MDCYKVIKYSESYFQVWNDFVSQSKNGTFLFQRDFMDYHAHKFEDFSLMVFKNNKLVAILPANKLGNTIVSHQGLTYGGLVLSKKITLKEVFDIFEKLLKFLENFDITVLNLKLIPRIYNLMPSDEIDYILFKLRAELYRRDITISIDHICNLNLQSLNRLRNLKKGTSAGIVVREAQDFSNFWTKILIPNLKSKFKLSPTHTLYEITLLKAKFPNNIKQFNAYHNDEIIAGITIFETKNVAHAQYIAKHVDKDLEGGLDVILDYLINTTYKNKRYFDFGISNEQEGQFVNEGLQAWKESFGGRSISHDFYTINVENYKLLKNVFI